MSVTGLVLALDLLSLRLLLAGLGGMPLAVLVAKVHTKALAVFAHRGAQALELGLALLGLALVSAVLAAGVRIGRPPNR